MTTLLAIGDMHLGRPPTAVPEDLKARRDELGPEAAWKRAVDEAVRREVDGVLLAGDLVDRGRDFFVAYGQLKAGVERLAGAGIPVLAVAGNHDTDVLPRLAEEIDALELLGADGRWQTRDLGDTTIVGWSFLRPQVRGNPLSDFSDTRHKGTVIGLLHCDLDQGDSPHAPVPRRDLEATAADAWLLGHIHRPDALEGGRPIGYLGSISALRASETGARGPWLIEADGKRVKARHLPMAPLAYAEVEIDVDGLDDPARLGDRVLAGARQTVQGFADWTDTPVAVGLRVTLTGHSERAGALMSAAEELAADGRSWNESGIACFIHKLDCAVLPSIDLKRLAHQADPRGLLARRLLALDDPDSEEYQRLIEQAREAMQPVIGSREFSELAPDADDAAVADWLQRAGRIALVRLTEQREAAR